jgi:hypothetical protein
VLLAVTCSLTLGGVELDCLDESKLAQRVGRVEGSELLFAKVLPQLHVVLLSHHLGGASWHTGSTRRPVSRSVGQSQSAVSVAAPSTHKCTTQADTGCK